MQLRWTRCSTSTSVRQSLSEVLTGGRYFVNPRKLQLSSGHELTRGAAERRLI
jgi:hypothetical protein